MSSSTKVGNPSVMRIDPLVPNESGNPGYAELWDPAGIDISEMGRRFDEAAALTEGAGGTSTGQGSLSNGKGRPLPDFAVLSADPAQIFVGSQFIRDPSTGTPLGDAQGELYLT